MKRKLPVLILAMVILLQSFTPAVFAASKNEVQSQTVSFCSLNLTSEGAAGAAKASKLDDIFSNPNLLKNTTPDEVKALANKEGWQVGSLSKGSQAGNGLTIRDGKDRLIQWHPGGGHHGAESYWKVSSGSTGTQRIGPQFGDTTGGGASK